MLGRCSGDMPPPRSRMRIVTPGVSGSGGVGMKPVGLSMPGETEDDGESGETVMVTSTGSLSFPLSTVARKAFLRSSVIMYSR